MATLQGLKMNFDGYKLIPSYTLNFVHVASIRLHLFLAVCCSIDTCLKNQLKSIKHINKTLLSVLLHTINVMLLRKASSWFKFPL